MNGGASWIRRTVQKKGMNEESDVDMTSTGTFMPDMGFMGNPGL